MHPGMLGGEKAEDRGYKRNFLRTGQVDIQILKIGRWKILFFILRSLIDTKSIFRRKNRKFSNAGKGVPTRLHPVNATSLDASQKLIL